MNSEMVSKIWENAALFPVYIKTHQDRTLLGWQSPGLSWGLEKRIAFDETLEQREAWKLWRKHHVVLGNNCLSFWDLFLDGLEFVAFCGLPQD